MAPSKPPVWRGLAQGEGGRQEVWHWLAASERLTRCTSFAEHPAVRALVQRAGEGDQESQEAVSRWQSAARQLRQLQKESGWNARYLRVVEEPLALIASEDAVREGALGRTTSQLMRSLQRIYVTSSYFKESRMALLLHKVLKVLVSQAGSHLVSPHQ
ncbi:unnamed protein product, partial [Prorocentrum cordatum]